MDDVQSFFVTIEKTWVAECVLWPYLLSKYKFKEHLSLYALIFVIDSIDGILYNLFLQGTPYSETAFLIYLLNINISISIILECGYLNRYLLLLIISTLELISFLIRVLVQ